MVEPTRTDRRRARTRGALVAAAQQLLAEGRTEVSIQEITCRADVGFGSFYNHFSDKAELWRAAMGELLTAHAELVASLTADIEDPAEVFCVGLRLTGRRQRVFPELGKVLLHTALADILQTRGLADAALRDLRAAVEAGRFDVGDPELAVALAAGALLGLLQTLDSRPDADAGALSDDLAVRLLLAFGLRRADARRLVGRPLPAGPSAGWA